MPHRRTSEFTPILEKDVLQSECSEDLDRASINAIRMAKLSPSCLRVNTKHRLVAQPVSRKQQRQEKT